MRNEIRKTVRPKYRRELEREALVGKLCQSLEIPQAMRRDIKLWQEKEEIQQKKARMKRICVSVRLMSLKVTEKLFI